MEKQIQKFSLSKCKSVLNKNGSLYTDEQIIAIRDFFYQLAEWEYETFLKIQMHEAKFDIGKQNPLNEEELKQAA